MELSAICPACQQPIIEHARDVASHLFRQLINTIRGHCGVLMRHPSTYLLTCFEMSVPKSQHANHAAGDNRNIRLSFILLSLVVSCIVSSCIYVCYVRILNNK